MKLDINVSKTITVNTGNYSSVKPSVSITVKDVDVQHIKNVHKKVSDLVSNLLYEETVDMCDNSKTIQEVGIDHFLSSYEHLKNDIANENEKIINELMNISSGVFTAADMEKMLKNE